MQPTVLQILPSLDYGGVERGTVEIANELVRRKHKSIVMSANGRLVSELTASGTEHIDLPVGEKSIMSIRLIPKIDIKGSNLVKVMQLRHLWKKTSQGYKLRHTVNKNGTDD